LMMACAALAIVSGSALAATPKVGTQDAQLAQPAPMFLAQRRSTPDTSMPGSTGPANPVNTRPAYVSQKDQYYAAELRRCETIGAPEERRACKDSARSKFGEM
jgi:hypothetical protein